MTTVATTPNTDELQQTYTYLDSFRHWWKRSSLDRAEEDVLSLLSFYPDSDGVRTGETTNVLIDEKNHIHEFNVKNIQASDREDHIVLIHGYGAALGFFYKNFEDLTERPGVNLHALDLLGYGLSSRPNLPKFHGNSIEDVKIVEDFFIESIEKWREAKKIEKFLLIGHSLGGYLSSLYTLKYPEHVSKLVLISPVGVERSIFDLSSPQIDTASLTEGPDIEREVGRHNKNTDEHIKTSSSLHVPDENGYVTRVPNLPRVLQYIWNHNLSPFTLIRGLGPIGPHATSKWSFRRFGNVDDNSVAMKLHYYSYTTFVARASGEYALTRLLAPGALARYPLLNRLPGQLKVDSLWLYGDVDWMSKEAGSTVVKEINREGPNKADYKVISGAGHHIYIDNPVDFKNSVYKFFGW